VWGAGCHQGTQKTKKGLFLHLVPRTKVRIPATATTGRDDPPLRNAHLRPCRYLSEFNGGPPKDATDTLGKRATTMAAGGWIFHVFLRTCLRVTAPAHMTQTGAAQQRLPSNGRRGYTAPCSPLSHQRTSRKRGTYFQRQSNSETKLTHPLRTRQRKGFQFGVYLDHRMGDDSFSCWCSALTIGMPPVPRFYLYYDLTKGVGLADLIIAGALNLHEYQTASFFYF